MTIVYTAVLGGSDSLKAAPTGADQCVCFVNDKGNYPDSMGWELRERLWLGDARRAAWHIRCVPHQVFGDYDRVVWIDGSFTLTDLPRLLADAGGAPIAALRHDGRNSPYWEGERLVKIGQARAQDIRPQLAAYELEGFDVPHLSIACVLVRDHGETSRQFNETWAAEIDRWRGDNTQVSLDYSAWKHGATIRGLTGTRHTNPYGVHDHADHRRRRRPYQVTTA